MNDLPKVIEEFGVKVRRVLKEQGWSYRGATIATGIDHGTIGYMASGIIPKKGVIIDWAVAIGEDMNTWLELAEYPPLPIRIVNAPADRVREVVAKYTVPGKGLTRGEVEAMRQEIEALAETPEGKSP